jgi:hypothetical protein
LRLPLYLNLGDSASYSTGSSVVVGNDLSADRRGFLIIDNGREIDVHVRVPLPDVALHDGKVVRLDSQDASAACNIVPAADDLHAIPSIRP